VDAVENPPLSVVVAIVSDTTERRPTARALAACLDAFSKQVDAPPLEIIVPHHGDVEGLDGLRRRFPDVNFLPVNDRRAPRAGREHHDVLRARGLSAARGAVIGLVEDHARPDEHWCANVVAAHRKPYAAIGGAIENGIDRPLNWAVYYCDFGRYQRPLPAGESPFASDANITYKRSALEAIRPTWERSFREVVVNGALASRGEKVGLQPDIVVYQNRAGLRLRAAVRELFIWGRSYAATRTALLSRPWRLAYALLSPVLPVILLVRMTRTAGTRRRRFGKFLGALPLIVILLTAWSTGEGVGYLTGRASGSPGP
jgi:hypothetical protein